MHPVFANLPTTVFEVMSRLAREHDAINLGQGFPDDPGPEDVRQKAAEAVVSGVARGGRETLCALATRFAGS
jgi:N-succinyldiaminopimelate aminotransferase